MWFQLSVFLNRVISVEKTIDYTTPFVTAYVTFCPSVLFTATAYFEMWSLPPTVLLARDNWSQQRPHTVVFLVSTSLHHKASRGRGELWAALFLLIDDAHALTETGRDDIRRNTRPDLSRFREWSWGNCFITETSASSTQPTRILDGLGYCVRDEDKSELC